MRKELLEKYQNLLESEYIVYHGTNNKFTKFDKQYQKEGLYGRGFYFTPHYKYAKAFGNVIKCSVTINKPVKVTPRRTPNVLHKIMMGNGKYDYGYDGVITYDIKGNVTEVIAFDPDQIKIL